MTYVVITTLVLIILNVYCYRVAERLAFRDKSNSLVEKCQLASDELAALDELTSEAIPGALGQLESLTAARLIITDIAGVGLYDSAAEAVGKLILLPEVIQALDGESGFYGSYRKGLIFCRSAVPILRRGEMVGCVYMTEYDAARGALIHGLRVRIFQITAGLEIVVLLFSLFYSTRFSSRLGRILNSMRIIRSGDYSHRVALAGKDELALLGQEINDLTDRLQIYEEKRTTFVSDASHEIKTPLTSIKLLSDSILQNDMDRETMLEFVADIGSEAERLNRMSEKLLSLTRIDSQLEKEPEIILVAPTVRRVGRILQPTARASGVEIQLELEERCPILIEEDDLYQIIFNLMENGIKYNSPGGSLRLNLRREGEDVILTVRDTGIGIPEGALNHLFDRFYRVDKSRSRATGGSGLGLSIVHSLVEANGGTISVSSKPGEGSCFTVTFPLFDPEARI